jgi:tetratricopeptide (TPR) repeat protein
MSTSAFDELVNRGATAHQANQYEEALAAYKQALDLQPDDAEALSLYGLALTHLGRLEEAGPVLEKAVETEPEQVGFRLNLVEYLEKSQQLDRADQEIDAAVALDASLVRAWEKKGDVSMKRDQLNAAANAYTAASSLDPENFRIVLKLARAHSGLGNFSNAHDALDIAERLKPRDADMFDLRCAVLMRERNWKGLEVASNLWADSDPENPRPWHRLTQATFEQGRYRQSVAAYEKLLKLAPRSAKNLAAFGRICLYALDLDKAASVLDEAEALNPYLTDLLAAKGLLLAYLGRLEEAETYCRRCLDIDPEFAPAYTQLTRLTSGHLSDPEMQTLARVVGDARKPVETRVFAGFALAHGNDAAGDIDEAFACYEQANRLRGDESLAEGLVYDRVRREARTDRLIELFSDSPKSDLVARDSTPIFIVGMPRSGTTLVESTLSAHSRVNAGGERVAMLQILRAYLATLAADNDRPPPATALQEWADYYLNELPPAAPADHITDKNPLNFESVGLIARLFPNAVIINMRRNPVETGLSVFRHELTKFLTFAHRLEDIGHYYGQYARLAAHWQKILPDRFVTIQYEDFAANFDTAAPALLDACGLEWEDACQSFQETAPVIATFSAVQAREPVAVRFGKAKAYEEHLGPLIDALTVANVDLETGELIS